MYPGLNQCDLPRSARGVKRTPHMAISNALLAYLFGVEINVLNPVVTTKTVCTERSNRAQSHYMCNYYRDNGFFKPTLYLYSSIALSMRFRSILSS